jgi:hypothetical protein
VDNGAPLAQQAAILLIAAFRRLLIATISHH